MLLLILGMIGDILIIIGWCNCEKYDEKLKSIDKVGASFGAISLGLDIATSFSSYTVASVTIFEAVFTFFVGVWIIVLSIIKKKNPKWRL